MAETPHTPSRLPASLDIQQQITDQSALAKVFMDSGLAIGPKSIPQAMVFIMAGNELGLAPFESMNAFDIIEGKVAARANTRATMVKRSNKYNYRILEHDETKCVIEWFEHGEKIGTSSFTIEEARAAQLAGKKNWQGYARDMLFARALARGQRTHCPEVMGGVNYYDRDEIVEGDGRDLEEEAPVNAIKSQVKAKLDVIQGGATEVQDAVPADPDAVPGVQDAVIVEEEPITPVPEEPAAEKKRRVTKPKETAPETETPASEPVSAPENPTRVTEEPVVEEPINLSEIAEKLKLTDVGKIQLMRIKPFPSKQALGELMKMMVDKFGNITDGLAAVSKAKAFPYEKTLVFLTDYEPASVTKVVGSEPEESNVQTVEGADGVAEVVEGSGGELSHNEQVSAIMGQFDFTDSATINWVKAGSKTIAPETVMAFFQFLKAQGLAPAAACQRRREKGKSLLQAMDAEDFEYEETE